MRRAGVFATVLAAGLILSPPLAVAQTIPSQTPILTIDSERLFLSSDFGQRVATEIEARGNELAAENRRIEAELAAEERDLTDRRAEMTPEAFRPLADAFDARVQETRAAQAAKSRALNTLLEREREIFLRAAGPILQDLMEEVGATVVLEQRSVFLSTNSIDITASAIARLNTVLGEGEALEILPPSEEAPATPND